MEPDLCFLVNMSDIFCKSGICDTRTSFSSIDSSTQFSRIFSWQRFFVDMLFDQCTAA